MILALLLASSLAQASTLTLSRVDIESRAFLDYTSPELALPNEHAIGEMRLALDFNAGSILYWKNTVQTIYTRNQFREVGWNPIVGAHVTPWLDVQYEHYSRHLLDAVSAGHYPDQDSIGAVLHVIPAKD